jgi:hypothetical protein
MRGWLTGGRSETLSTFLLAAAAGCLGAAAVGAFELELLLYPAYFALVNAATAAVIMLRWARPAMCHAVV